MGHAIALLILPLLTRTYPVDVFGRAASTLALLGVIALIASLQYDQAIVVAKREELPYLLLLCVVLVGSTATVLFIGNHLIVQVGGDVETVWRRLGFNGYLAFLTLGYSTQVLLGNLALRRNQIARLGAGRLIYYAGTPVLQLFGAWTLSPTEGVFLSCQAAAAFLACCTLFPLREATCWLSSGGQSVGSAFTKGKEIALHYKNFPKYQVAAQTLNAASSLGPVVFIRYFFSDKWAGWYFLAWRLLAAPTTLLAQAVGQILYRDVAERYRNEDRSPRRLEEAVSMLVRLSLLPAVGIGLLAPVGVVFFLGQEWRETATMVRFLLPSFVVLFFTSPISQLLNIKGMQKSILGYYSLLFVARFGGLSIGVFVGSIWASVAGHTFASVAALAPFFAHVMKEMGASGRRVLQSVFPSCARAAFLLGAGLAIVNLPGLSESLRHWALVLLLVIVGSVELVRGGGPLSSGRG